jgi:hypothetical protein
MPSTQKPFRLEFRDEQGRWCDEFFTLDSFARYAVTNYRAAGYREVSLYCCGQRVG